MLTFLDVESRTGCLFCQMCDDFVWDPTLEEMRLRKLGTGSFTGKYIFLTCFLRLKKMVLTCTSQTGKNESMAISSQK
jgi:hypothetical protein